jgi:hypothetical protein
VLYTNDIEYYANIVNSCYLSNKEMLDKEEIEKHISIIERLPLIEDGFIYNNYAPKDDTNIQLNERVFYTTRNAKFIDTVKHYIFNYVSEQQQKFLLAPLLVKASIHTNTSGVFKGFYKNKEGIGCFGGEGKNALINAILLMNEFINDLPQGETPYEANYDEGYWHINSLTGSSDKMELDMILREFDKNKLLKREKSVIDSVNRIQNKYPKAKLTLTIKDQYENMRPYVEANPKALEFAEKALIKNGLTPQHTKIRGGTDGATFSKMGLVTPNLGTGSANHHGRYEYLVIQDFLKMIDVVIDIVKI